MLILIRVKVDRIGLLTHVNRLSVDGVCACERMWLCVQSRSSLQLLGPTLSGEERSGEDQVGGCVLPSGDPLQLHPQTLCWEPPTGSSTKTREVFATDRPVTSGSDAEQRHSKRICRVERALSSLVGSCRVPARSHLSHPPDGCQPAGSLTSVVSATLSLAHQTFVHRPRDSNQRQNTRREVDVLPVTQSDSMNDGYC
jgi:hypothetical protein